MLHASRSTREANERVERRTDGRAGGDRKAQRRERIGCLKRAEERQEELAPLAERSDGYSLPRTFWPRGHETQIGGCADAEAYDALVARAAKGGELFALRDVCVQHGRGARRQDLAEEPRLGGE